MSESAKTLSFIAVAAVAVAVSFIAKPQSAVYDVSEQIGKMLTKQFAPEAAKRLTVVEFDEETATIREFEVAESDGVWTIPSKGGYPADAERQMAEATTGVTDREILQIASESAADHEQFGVVDPRSPKLEVGQTGVGLRVTLADEDDGPLADLIIGKEVKDEPDQHYVRRQTQDVVYVVEVDPSRFSTSFEDWIEDDLLKISPWDILRVQIKDYTAELVIRDFTPTISWDRRGEFTLRYEDSDSKWVAEELLAYDEASEEFQLFQLSESEELNEDALRELKNALDDLLIVDVESKPAGLSANLKAGGDFLNDTDSVASLVRRGFAPVPLGPDEVEILSSEGEVVCTMKDGVEYVLRFGNLQLREGEETASAEAGEAESDESDEAEEDEGVSRYLFVLARFNDSVVEKPELEEPPKAQARAEERSPSDAGADDTNAAETAEDDNEAGRDDSAASESEEYVSDDSERKAIEQRNQQKQDEYDQTLKEGVERVEELNARFGDWYYVISNSVYSKMRLGRDDIVEQKEVEDAGKEAEADDPNASALGAPGSAVPGLPDIGGLGGGDDEADDSSAETE